MICKENLERHLAAMENRGSLFRKKRQLIWREIKWYIIKEEDGGLLSNKKMMSEGREGILASVWTTEEGEDLKMSRYKRRH